MEILKYQENDLQGKTALITGASAGIGEACAYLLAAKGMNLNLVARREQRLETIRAHCRESFPEVSVNYVAGDINSASTIEQMSEKKFFLSEVCINNAGLAIGRDSVADSRLEDWETMIDTNIKSAFKVVRQCLPHMKRHGGDIISLGSIAGHWDYPNGAVYCASKAALRYFMGALRKETYGQDIRVMLLSPGMVETEFSLVRFRGDRAAADQVYQGVHPLTAMDMAHHILYMLSRPRHVNIEDLISMPTDQGSASLIAKKP